ncbi:MAG: sulfatase-like hydrolase/transferase, partial [Bacteroidia bacterium]|nr:sulfatase-like hydrolase/transferase [Bacteroidia bacterium]
MKKLLNFLTVILFFIISCQILSATPKPDTKKPNIVFIIVDQWRAQATGYSGDKNVITPNIDRLASSSVNVKNAVSGMPVCTPFRASLI